MNDAGDRTPEDRDPASVSPSPEPTADDRDAAAAAPDTPPPPRWRTITDPPRA